MLVLSRKSQESVVVGGSDGFHHLLKVTVIGIQGASEAGLRGRCRGTCPSIGGVGTDQRERSSRQSARRPHRAA